jgi:hypothetical protein
VRGWCESGICASLWWYPVEEGKRIIKQIRRKKVEEERKAINEERRKEVEKGHA